VHLKLRQLQQQQGVKETERVVELTFQQLGGQDVDLDMKRFFSDSWLAKGGCFFRAINAAPLSFGSRVPRDSLCVVPGSASVVLSDLALCSLEMVLNCTA